MTMLASPSFLYIPLPSISLPRTKSIWCTNNVHEKFVTHVALQGKARTVVNNREKCTYNSSCNLKSTNQSSLVDSFGGRMVMDGMVYRQTLPVRSFELGSDGRISIVALTKHLQDTALNHTRSIRLLADGFGSTKEMIRHNLIWVISTMHILVDNYPSWADVMEIDTWTYTTGKNGLGRDWVVHDAKTGETLVQATSVMVLLNKNTRRLSKFTNELREEIAFCLMDCDSITNKDSRNVDKVDSDTADYVRRGLTPGRSDMDVNRHVSNYKYIDWILESVPCSFMERNELCAITLEYRREVDSNSVLQSLSKSTGYGNGCSTDPGAGGAEFEHALRLDNGSEIMRARTTWKPKYPNNYLQDVQYS